MKLFGLFRSILAALLLTTAAFADEPLIVHEWGTITSRHSPDGTALGQLNRIQESEVLPPFVRRWEPEVTRGRGTNEFLKTPQTPGRPDVNMRLETPVIYFYPPKGVSFDAPFNVSVQFRGGILNEFYPPAEAGVKVDVERINAKAKAVFMKRWDGKMLDNFVVGSLEWKNVRLAATISPPDTGSDIWLAPRRVNSSGVQAYSGESEKYLFYRGVAHLDALFQTELTAKDVTLKAPVMLHWLTAPSMSVSKVWVADLREGGAIAFHEQANLIINKANPSGVVGSIPLFSQSDFASANYEKLRGSMKRALVEAGLFEDEAEAMLKTWNKSYFETPGLRVFYIVPREWTQYFLPLKISVPNETTRVLVGRIDIVRP